MMKSNTLLLGVILGSWANLSMGGPVTDMPKNRTPFEESKKKILEEYDPDSGVHFVEKEEETKKSEEDFGH